MVALTLDNKGALSHEGALVADMRTSLPQDDLFYFLDRQKANVETSQPLEVTIFLSRSAPFEYCKRFFDLTEGTGLKVTIELGNMES